MTELLSEPVNVRREEEGETDSDFVAMLTPHAEILARCHNRDGLRKM